MLSPGNHEVIDGSLESYMRSFGLPEYAYCFEYGNSLFVSLNSAISSSISAADPTQFDYLQRLLEKNTKQNIFVFTHVPTRDSFGTAHEMPKSDADRLEKILGDYKKAYPGRNINVMFGNLHVSQTWEVSGVNYVITGNGSLKRYVSPENGGFLGYSKFIVNGSRVSQVFVPLVNKVAIMDSGLKGGEMRIIKGSKKQINLFGDFSFLNADYIINLSKFKNMGITWQSDNPSAVAVSQDGILTANGIGSANIKATLGGKSHSIKVVSIDPKDIITVSIGVNPGTLNTTQGVRTTLQTLGYDLYGNSFTIDNSLVKYEASKNIGGISGGVFTAAAVKSEQTGSITVSYAGCTSSITAKVAAPKKYAVVTSKTLNVRDKAATNGKIVGALVQGTKVEVLDELNGWLKINYNGKAYYILKQYTKQV
jgi:hypothetical protein